MTALPSASSRLLLLLCHAAAVVADQAVIIERMYSGGACSSANLYEEATFPAGRCIANSHTADHSTDGLMRAVRKIIPQDGGGGKVSCGSILNLPTPPFKRKRE